MKKSILFLLLLLPFCFSYAQNKDALILEGAIYYMNGDYDKAVESYEDALDMEPESAHINAALAITHMYAGNYDKAIQFSDKAISLNDDEFLEDAYLAKSTCLDILNRTDEAIRVLEPIAHKYEDSPVFFYNLGYNYFRVNNAEKAEDAFMKSLKLDPNNSGTNLFLGLANNMSQNTTESLLSLYYFLLLEPNTERSEVAYSIIVNELEELAKDNRAESSEENFIKNTRSFFGLLQEKSQSLNSDDFEVYNDLYIPFYSRLVKSHYLEAFCYYIMQSKSDYAKEWIEDNGDIVHQFADWLQFN